MAYRNFTIAQMLDVTGPWVDDSHPERTVLAGVATTAALLPHVAAAHEALIGSQRDDAERVRQEHLSGMLAESDADHDDGARTTWFGLQTHEHLFARDPVGARYRQIRELLFPAGLAIVQASYREAAGQARLRAALIDDEVAEILAAIPLADARTLLEVVQDWNRAGERMGELERERATPTPDNPKSRPIVAARNGWIRILNTMHGVLELEGPEHPALARILERLERVDAEIERRARRGGDDGEDETPGDGLPGDGAEGPGDVGDALPGDDGQGSLGALGIGLAGDELQGGLGALGAGLPEAVNLTVGNE
ncbi:hypothetical protein [Haliangium sp.]|uniref:hypothetical protein n=1 Tax=Haliangium sp. TaxID=2663208 RepID=UPI003D13AE4C